MPWCNGQCCLRVWLGSPFIVNSCFFLELWRFLWFNLRPELKSRTFQVFSKLHHWHLLMFAFVPSSGIWRHLSLWLLYSPYTIIKKLKQFFPKYSDFIFKMFLVKCGLLCWQRKDFWPLPNLKGVKWDVSPLVCKMTKMRPPFWPAISLHPLAEVTYSCPAQSQPQPS